MSSHFISNYLHSEKLNNFGREGPEVLPQEHLKKSSVTVCHQVVSLIITLVMDAFIEFGVQRAEVKQHQGQSFPLKRIP